MTDDELVEAVARRLHDTGNAADPTGDFTWNCRDAALNAMARECIRIAKWARRSYVVHRCPNDCPGCNECWDVPPQPPLTLPPDDWAPDQAPE